MPFGLSLAVRVLGVPVRLVSTGASCESVQGPRRRSLEIFTALPAWVVIVLIEQPPS
jgi:hypothetical protein